MAGLLAACGGEPRVPAGEPLQVVRSAPEATQQAGRAEVYLDAPGESVTGLVDLDDPASSELSGRVRDLLELLEGAETAVPFGGQQVRGAASFRYEVTTAGGGRIDVWIDNLNRVRRVQAPAGPLPPADGPPPTQPNGLPALVTIDLVFAS